MVAHTAGLITSSAQERQSVFSLVRMHIIRTPEATMSSYHFVHHNVERIDIDEELQSEVRLLIERVDRQVEKWAHDHPTSTLNSDRPPLILEDTEGGEEAQK
jgi:hypothetical protein